MVSIKDVAREAGVAISTVSKVLNNYPNVSEETRKKVYEVVDRLGFVPNTVAAALSSKKSGRIALLVKMNLKTQAIDEINMQYISGAICKAREMQMDVITIFYSMISDMNVEEMTRYFTAQSIGGIIIYGMDKEDMVLHELIDSGNFKIVVVDAPMVNENTSEVTIDHKQAQKDVACKAIEGSDVKSILYIAGMKNGYVTDLRLEGIREFVQEESLELTVKEGDFSELKAREITFEYGKDTDAIVCASDLMAIGAMKALIEMDVFHPVCGFDGIILMGYVGKQMHTVRQDFAGISAAAVSELQRLFDGEAGQKVLLPYELVRLKYEDIIR
ncbi:MAG: LacI family transcriptional regulator [Butyrivibrio sp.]|nr:LacI family transcriptional regulator [Butyrivibrio sp.]